MTTLSGAEFLQHAARALGGFLDSAGSAGRLGAAEVIGVEALEDGVVVEYTIGPGTTRRWTILLANRRLPRTDEAARDFAADAYDGFREHLADEGAATRRRDR